MHAPDLIRQANAQVFQQGISTWTLEKGEARVCLRLLLRWGVWGLPLARGEEAVDEGDEGAAGAKKQNSTWPPELISIRSQLALLAPAASGKPRSGVSRIGNPSDVWCSLQSCKLLFCRSPLMSSNRTGQQAQGPHEPICMMAGCSMVPTRHELKNLHAQSWEWQHHCPEGWAVQEPALQTMPLSLPPASAPSSQSPRHLHAASAQKMDDKRLHAELVCIL